MARIKFNNVKLMSIYVLIAVGVSLLFPSSRKFDQATDSFSYEIETSSRITEAGLSLEAKGYGSVQCRKN